MDELGSFYGGLTGKTKKDFGDGAAFVTYVNVYNNPAVDFEDLGRVQVKAGERQNAIQAGDILFTISSENREDCGMTSVVVEQPNEVCYLNSFCTGLRFDEPTTLDPVFAKHLFRSEYVRQQIRKACSGVTRFNISKPKLLKVTIPIPPIDQQTEIAGHLEALDTRTERLLNELNNETALLEAQLSEFRNQLLTFPEKAA